MTRGEGACLVCGKPIIYFEKAKKMECIMCHKTFESYASCEEVILYVTSVTQKKALIW